jgi:signal recognition particle subunit SRP54
MLGEKLRTAMERLRKATSMDKATLKEVIKDLQRALFSADVEVSLVLDLSKRIENEASKQVPPGLTKREHIIKVTYDLLTDFLGGQEAEIPQKPKRLLLLGLFGSGKTTSTVKLARYYSKRGLKVGVVCADTYRPAAYEQLKQLSEANKISFYGDLKEKNAAKIVKAALKVFEKSDLIIVDSAGRSGLDKELTQEIKDINKVFEPDATFLVLSADIGQAAKKQAQAFHQAVGINGVIITKIDGSAKGGGALAACHATDSPVYFIGTGEKIGDFTEFNAQRYLSRIMGYGDMQALLEKAKEAEMPAEEQMQSIMKGEFNLQLFYDQLKAARSMGPLSKVMDLMGLKQQLPEDLMEVSEKKLDSFKFIMDSMTKKEKLQPELLNKSRIDRIAKGSGRKTEEVRELIAHYKKMKKMFKKFSKVDAEKQMKKGKFDLNSLMGKMGAGRKKKFRLK